VFSEIRLRELIVCEGKISIHFDRLAALSYGFVIRVRQDEEFCQIGVDDKRLGFVSFRIHHPRVLQHSLFLGSQLDPDLLGNGTSHFFLEC